MGSGSALCFSPLIWSVPPFGAPLQENFAASFAFASRRSVPLGDYARLKRWLKERRLAKKLH
jgi:hypothetical protein